MKTCRACAVDNKLKRAREWSAIGVCPVCRERHILYNILGPTPRADVMDALLAHLQAEDLSIRLQEVL